MRIERTELVSNLVAFAMEGNGVIIGQPGVGKSYSIDELRQRLQAMGIPYLVLPVERLGGGSVAELKAVLRRDGDLVTLLRSVDKDPSVPGILIFDGFDAARGELERAGVFQLILLAVQGLKGSWNTIVSVRTFDATKSRKLLDLFPESSTTTGSANPKCRQFVIPSLISSEVEQALVQIPNLRTVHDEGTPTFRTLLTVPFNLWLIERVLNAGAKNDEFSQITSEVQLLKMYWDYRVTKLNDSSDREFILKLMSQSMVKSHSLTVPRDQIYKPDVKTAWEGLLSDEIIKELSDDKTHVSFTHNILFDFSVSTQLLDKDPIRFAEFVAEEPSRPIFLRPSLVYHFTLLWHFHREQFWSNLWAILYFDAIHLRQIVRIVLPAVVVNEAHSLDDLEPLLKRLNTSQQKSVEAVTFLFQALRALKSNKTILWADFLRSIGSHLDSAFAWEAGKIGLEMVESRGPLLPTALPSIGEFSRSLLSWTWKSRNNIAKKQWHERLASLVAIPLVVQTYSTDTRAAQILLKDVLAVMSEPEFPIDCIYRMTESIEHLIPYAPGLVSDIYECVFDHDETSTAQTTMGGSTVMCLLSNRRQDYDMCRYNLTEKYPLYIATSFEEALKAGLRSVQAFERQKHLYPYLREGTTLDDLTFEFSFFGGTSQYIEDGSVIWDSSSYPDKEVMIADQIFKCLLDSARNKDTTYVENFLKLFSCEAKMAFLWARLLMLGSQDPSFLGVRLWELAKAKPIMEGNDNLYSLGKFLENTFEFLSAIQQQQIEESILAIGMTEDVAEKPQRERLRDRLISCIQPCYLKTAGAKDLRISLQEKGALQSNTPLYSSSSFWRKTTDEDILSRQGVKTDSSDNKELRELYRPLAEWCDDNKDETKIDGLLSNVFCLQELLSKETQADEAQVSMAWVRLSAFVSKALLLTSDPNSERFKTLRAIALNLASHEAPLPNPERDVSWKTAAWAPAPRNAAAVALPWLTHFGQDKEALTAIQHLAQDPVPSVRFILACELWRISEHLPADMWLIIDKMVTSEDNGVVLQGLTNSLCQLISKDKDKSLVLIMKLMHRFEDETDDDSKVRSALIMMTVDYAVQYENQWAIEMIASWQKSPLKYPMSLNKAGQQLIDYIHPQFHGKHLNTARDLLLPLLDAVASGLSEMQMQSVVEGKKLEERQNTFKLLYGVINDAVTRLFFAADVVPSRLKRTKPPTITEKQRHAFFVDALPVLQKIIAFGKQKETGMLLASTAHHFMELLNGVLVYDPPLVLSLAADVVSCSKRFNYTIDPMAMREAVSLVETILADHRESIQLDASINNLLALLDAFVEVGWPEALNLVWRLDEIYR